MQRPELKGRPWQALFLFLDAAYDPGPEMLGALYQPGASWLMRGYLAELLAEVDEAVVALNVLRPLVTTDEAEIRQQTPKWASQVNQLVGFNFAVRATL